MQNILINMCEKFYYDRLRNDRALGNRKPDNNNPTTTTFIAIVDPFPSPKIALSKCSLVEAVTKMISVIRPSFNHHFIHLRLIGSQLSSITNYCSKFSIIFHITFPTLGKNI